MQRRGRTTRGRVVAAAVTGAAVLAAHAGAAPAFADKPPIVRKNAKDLTEAERDRFLDAVIALKHTPSPYEDQFRYKLLGGLWSEKKLSWYDQFVVWHHRLFECDPAANRDEDLMQPGMRGHGGPMFLPWHREFVRRFEEALQEVSGKDIAVPYWDWTREAHESDPDSVLGDDFMGGDGDPAKGYTLTGSRFAPGGKDPNKRKDDFRIAVNAEGVAWRSSATEWLTRRLGHFGKPITLPKEAEVVATLGSTDYDAHPFNTRSKLGQSFRNHIEGMRGDRPFPTINPPVNHGVPFHTEQCGPDGFLFAMDGSWLHALVHQWVGGTLPPSASADGVGPAFGSVMTPTSPNDPLFFLLHAHIDRVWASWQHLHADDGAAGYVPKKGDYPGNLRRDTMIPFDGVTPADVEDTRDLGYVYDKLLSPLPSKEATTARAASEPPAMPAAERRLLWQVCRLAVGRRAAR